MTPELLEIAMNDEFFIVRRRAVRNPNMTTDLLSIALNDEELDVNLVMAGKSDTIVANWIIQNLTEFRKDCVAFISPQNVNTGEILMGNTSEVAEDIVDYRNRLTSSSYFVIDTGFKYQYDRYNDTYRWVPLNGDIAGLCARTDYTDDPWFSPAGLNRGQIKNVVRLAYSPRKADRDTLYKSGINPVVSFPGQGVVLFGDKTGLSKPSAFDRINVRRLFIVLEKAIATAAKYQLFEFNDAFTRATFRNMVEPYLRDVKGRRGVYDFRVVCDESNNTGEVIDTNRFVADIYIKPARSINFITLNFIATRTSASFTEIAAGNSN
jgi:phage tail sheath protein FI